MINEFEKAYMEKYWAIQRLQWDNYFEDGNNDLSKIDAEIYNIAVRFRGKITAEDRKSQIARGLINRDCADKNPVTSHLRNRIDNLENYNEDIPEEIRRDRYSYKLALAGKMRNDVMSLMLSRNKLAQEIGYCSYPELVLAAEELDKSKLICLLNRYLDKNLSKTLELIKKYDITWESWFSDLNRIGKTSIKYSPVELMDKLLEKLGLNGAKNRIKVYLKEEGHNGFAAAISPVDVRIVVAPIESLNNLKVLFHEIGHAVLYSLNKEGGLYKTFPASFDEAMAVIIETIAPLVLLDEWSQERINDVIVLENTRCAISALYEFDLWENPDMAEELYFKHYSRFGIEIKNPEIWASDTFRSLDAVYIHSYVIGAELAQKTIEYLNTKYTNNYRDWGNWLFENLYSDGRKRPLIEKLKVIGDII